MSALPPKADNACAPRDHSQFANGLWRPYAGDFLELWEPRGWILKVYLHSAHDVEQSGEYLAKAKTFIQPQLLMAERIEPSHRVGFMILSHGVVSNWVMLDWWSSFNIYQKIFRAEGMPPVRFIEAPVDLFQCVYDLRITAFESEA
jgi:hypothetical protein